MRRLDDIGPETLVNDKLREWSEKWILDGDLVRCRECGRGIIYSRRGEKLVHTADCREVMAYPWELLVALAPPRDENAEGDARREDASNSDGE